MKPEIRNIGAEYCDERVCVSVCLSAITSSELHASYLHQVFLCMLPISVVRSYSGGVAICYVFPVSWMTSYFHTN